MYQTSWQQWPFKYLNRHTVAILCPILYVQKYIYRMKKELCESEQRKCLNSKSALTLYKLEVKSLHPVRFLHCFPSHMHDFLQTSNLVLLSLFILYQLLFCNVLEYLKHCNICFFIIECQKQAKRHQNSRFSTMRSSFDLCMPPHRFQNLYQQHITHKKYI